MVEVVCVIELDFLYWYGVVGMWVMVSGFFYIGFVEYGDVLFGGVSGIGCFG